MTRPEAVFAEWILWLGWGRQQRPLPRSRWRMTERDTWCWETELCRLQRTWGSSCCIPPSHWRWFCWQVTVCSLAAPLVGHVYPSWKSWFDLGRIQSGLTRKLPPLKLCFLRRLHRQRRATSERILQRHIFQTLVRLFNHRRRFRRPLSFALEAGSFRFWKVFHSFWVTFLQNKVERRNCNVLLSYLEDKDCTDILLIERIRQTDYRSWIRSFRVFKVKY